MIEKIEQILIQKYASDSLAHFYLVEPNLIDENNQSFEWIKKLITQMGSLSNSQLENHSEVLFINDLENKKQYTSEVLEEIFAHIVHQAIELKRKFLVINDAHKITEPQTNKLLKVFEEPPVNLTIFLINTRRVNLLNTINSRAIKLSLNLLENVKIHDFDLWKNDFSFDQFCNWLQETEKPCAEIVTILTDKANKTLKTDSDFNKFQNLINLVQIDLTYNTPSQSRNFKLFQCFKLLNA